jgi:hypothetical protein
VALGLFSASPGEVAGGQAAIVCCNVPVSVDEEWIGTNHPLGSQNLVVAPMGGQPYTRFSVRLDASGCPLPNLACT